jgi:methylmalonyl-CoA/ethylmalonyl-CoA epimerase
LKITRVNHLGGIVPDLASALAGFRDLLGLPLDHVETYGDELDIAFLPCGDTQVELIEPRRAGASATYLARHGAGIQHVAFEVEDLGAALAELAARGVRTLGEAPRPGAGNTLIAFLHPEPFGGLLVELCQPRP